MTIHQENQTEIIEKIQEIMESNGEWWDQAQGIMTEKTTRIESLLDIVSYAPGRSV